MGEWGMLSHPQNKESLPWTLGPSLEGDDREESQLATHPRRSSLRKRGSSQQPMPLFRNERRHHPRKSTPPETPPPTVILARARIQDKQFRFLGTLTPHQNKDSLPWTLGPSLEGDDREESRPAFYLGRHACESEHPEKLIPLFRDINGITNNYRSNFLENSKIISSTVSPVPQIVVLSVSLL